MNKDVWTDLNEVLDSGNVETAASLLRRYLDTVGYALCDGLRALVQFRGDGRYPPGDLLHSGLRKVSANLKVARQAANSWEKSELEKECAETLKLFEAAYQSVKSVEWIVNLSVYYHEWANLQINEFREVVKAYEALIRIIHCETCQSLLHTVFHEGQQDHMRCICGDKTYNLIQKKYGKRDEQRGRMK